MESREKQISALTAVTLLIVLLISHNFWLNDRIYSLVPIEPWLAVPNWLGNLLYALLLVFLTLAALFPKRLYNVACAFFLVALIALDQSRLQPYIYMYLATLLVLSLPPIYRATQLDCLRIMCASAYIWAGIQKINNEFYGSIVPQFISAFIPQDMMVNNFLIAVVLVFSVPVFEAMIGILYLTVKNKKIPLIMSATMLVVVLLCLGPLGLHYNVVIWPWNVWLFILSYRLFKENPSFSSIFSFKPHPIYAAKVAYVVLFGIMPVFALFDKWDGYLSFQLYSGNIYSASANIDSQELEKLPKPLRYYADNDTIDFVALGYGLYEVSLYPEKRIFLSVWKSWCQNYGLSKSTLVITKMGKHTVYDCSGNPYAL
jgi:uncharacterized membrane protein YphA (DoxX/SURF4 family)